MRERLLNDPKILDNTADAVLSVFRALKPPRKITTAEWADTYRYFAPEEGATQGKYKIDAVYYFTWKNNPLDAIDDPAVHELVFMKSAQIAYTTGVMGNYIGKRVTHDPAPMMVMFAQEYSAKAWNREKWQPMARATPILGNAIVPKGNWDHKEFAGGYLKLVNGNSIAGVKSSVIPIIFIEEPDDCNKNLAGQGDAITLAKERLKTFRQDQTKLVIGGTPTIKGISAVDNEMKLSDGRRGFVYCHECNEPHVLDFENLITPTDPTLKHPIYEQHDTAATFYACPICGAKWTWQQKNLNLKNKNNFFKASRPFNGIAGYYLNELYSNFPGSSFQILAEKKIKALHYFNTTGDPEPLIAYINSSEGRVFERIGEGRTVEELEAFGKSYPLGEVPEGGLILTAGVDVQHDRLEMTVRAWGRNNKSWLVDKLIFFGTPTDTASECWGDLIKVMRHHYPAARGRGLGISLVGIDSGFASEQVYSFIRATMSDKGLKGRAIAVKGSNNPDHTIFKKPRALDMRGGGLAKYDRYGVQLYYVGSQAAKTLIHNWLGLHGEEGAEPVFFWPSEVDDSYLQQLTSNIFTAKGKKYLWELKEGASDEALDTEVYSVHAMQALNVHRFGEKEWRSLERAAGYSETEGGDQK